MQPVQPAPINNNLTIAIVSVFFFWPLAIPAIINATKVNTLLAQGNYPAAQYAADQAKKFAKLGIIIGAALVALSCAFAGCAAVLAQSSGY
jgi:hypothetical protein